LEYLDPRDTIPHEDVVLNKVKDAIISVKETKSIMPPIVDLRTLIVIDGHHRREAVISMNFRKIPFYLVDYSKDEIIVGKWFRKVLHSKLSSLFVSSLKRVGDGDLCMRFQSISICSRNVYSLYWRLEWLEERLRGLGAKVDRDPVSGEEPPELTKAEIIRVAKTGLRFPPKTTRHLYNFIIPKLRVKL
jgi:hypothetical protein